MFLYRGSSSPYVNPLAQLEALHAQFRPHMHAGDPLYQQMVNISRRGLNSQAVANAILRASQPNPDLPIAREAIRQAGGLWNNNQARMLRRLQDYLLSNRSSLAGAADMQRNYIPRILSAAGIKGFHPSRLAYWLGRLIR